MNDIQKVKQQQQQNRSMKPEAGSLQKKKINEIDKPLN